MYGRIAGLKSVEFSSLDIESVLRILLMSIRLLHQFGLSSGDKFRTVTVHIDLLALDQDANLIVMELKRDKTPRDIIAQVLDYGSWVRELKTDRVAQIFDDYQKRWHSNSVQGSIDQAFSEKFKISMPDEINSNHELVIVASDLDASTERIVRYLADEYGVRINAIFFRVFKDEGREYISQAWFRDPAESDGGWGRSNSKMNGMGIYVSLVTS